MSLPTMVLLKDIMVNIDHISSLKISDENFPGTLQISLLGHEPIHIIMGDKGYNAYNMLIRRINGESY